MGRLKIRLHTQSDIQAEQQKFKTRQGQTLAQIDRPRLRYISVAGQKNREREGKDTKSGKLFQKHFGKEAETGFRNKAVFRVTEEHGRVHRVQTA